jgi:hypothetical protein
LDVIKRKDIALWLAFLVLAAWCTEGWIQPDEQARFLEPAHHLIYGYASLPWEFRNDPQIVSYLGGTLLAPVLWLTKPFGASGMTEAFLCRLFIGLVASTKLVALVLVFNLLRLEFNRRRLYLLISAFAIFGPAFYVRTSQENFGGTMLLWAFYFHLKNRESPSSSHSFWCGFLASFGTSIRLQLGPAALVLAMFHGLSSKKVKTNLITLLGLVVGLFPLAIVDLVKCGIPFLPAWNYLMYALGGEEGGHVWGTQPWWYYIQQYFEAWYPPLSILILPVMLMGLFLCPDLMLVIVPFVAVHVLIGHKETRYLFPMVPFLQLAAFVGWDRAARFQWQHWIDRGKTLFKTFFGGYLLFGSLSCIFILNSSPRMYSILGQLLRNNTIDSYTYLANSRTPPSEFFSKVKSDAGLKGITPLDDVFEGRTTVQGWVAAYALDPLWYEDLAQSCDVYYVSPGQWQRDLLKLTPKATPVRRRVNCIVKCAQPFKFSHR